MKPKPILMLMVWLLVLIGQQAHAFYNPGTGRWLNRDPIGENGGENLYAIWLNDYVNRFDLFGLCPGVSCNGDTSYRMNAGAPRGGKGNPAGDAKTLCQETLDKVKRDGGPKELPDNSSCTRCPKELSEALNNPIYYVKDLLDQFDKDCPKPSIRCAQCSGAGGWYDDTKKEIVVCHNDASFGSIAQTLAHELTHALQACYKKSTNCRDSLKKEMEAYYCARESFQFGDVYSDAVQSSCGTSPSRCTPDEVQNLYQELQEWFNKERENFCKFPRRPDYPRPSRPN